MVIAYEEQKEENEFAEEMRALKASVPASVDGETEYEGKLYCGIYNCKVYERSWKAPEF